MATEDRGRSWKVILKCSRKKVKRFKEEFTHPTLVRTARRHEPSDDVIFTGKNAYLTVPSSIVATEGLLIFSQSL
jgi:hypothetical protein